MKIYNKTIKLETKKRLELIDVTENLKKILKQSNVKEGFVNVFSKHTTLGIKINEYEPLLLKDMYEFLEKVVPNEAGYFHDKIELRKDCLDDEQKNADGHLKCLFLESSQTIPLKNSQMDLGKWQKIIVVETSGPREREIVVQVIGE